MSGIPDDGRIGPFTSNIGAPDPVHEFLLASEDLTEQIVPALLPACSAESATTCLAGSYQRPLERLYRRALGAEELDRLGELVTSLVASGVSAENATRAMLVSALLSADFLFRANPFDTQSARGQRLAEHLSYALTDSPPDADLVAASQSGTQELGARLQEQALQLSKDPRAVPVLARFVAQWLHVDLDAKLGDHADSFAASPLYAELLAFVHDALSANVTVKSFVNGSTGFVHTNQFEAYQIAPAASVTDVAKVSWGPESVRRGLVGEELFMDATRHPLSGRRPIFRGYLVRSSLLCETIAPPPPSVVDLDAEISDRTSDPRCSACHQKMDPIGKAFAPLDLDNTLGAPAPVVVGEGEVSGTYPSLPALLDAIANSQTFADCFSRHLLSFFLEQEPSQVDAASVQDIAALVKAGGGFADVVAQLAVSLERRSANGIPWCTGQ